MWNHCLLTIKVTELSGVCKYFWLSSTEKPSLIRSPLEALWRVKVPWRRRRRSEVWSTSCSEWVPPSWGLENHQFIYICSQENCGAALYSTDKQLVEVSSRSLSTHSLAQVEQRREMAPVSGEDLVLWTAGNPLFSTVRSQPSSAHTGNVFLTVSNCPKSTKPAAQCT